MYFGETKFIKRARICCISHYVHHKKKLNIQIFHNEFMKLGRQQLDENVNNG